MAKKFARLLLVVLSFATVGFTQQIPAWEIFGGYSFERSAVREYYKSTPIIYTFRERYENLNGWEVAVTENVNHWFGGTLQLTGHYKSPVVLTTKSRQNLFSIMYGPRFSHRMSWGTPYGHLLFGAGRTSVTVSPGPHTAEASFVVAGGGGLDLNLGTKAAIRVLQIQYSPMNQVAAKDHKFQASAGIVLYLGTAK